MKTITVLSADGTPLAVRVFEPETAVRGSVVIGGAMGVRQDFYEPFAQWLAAQGWRVSSFDYRGSGESHADKTSRSLRGFKADLFDWARDYEAVIDHAHLALPEQPLYLLGHSLGAQLPGLLNNGHKISGLLGVAAGNGYWRENAPQLKRSVLYFWFILVPLTTRLFGYFPGRKLRKVGDLPAGVVLQWRKWCLNPRYSVGAEGEAVRQRYANVRFPMLALSISDDEMMTLRGTHSLFNLYENAPREVRSITPAQMSVKRIGHFGAFRREQQARLWPLIEQSISGLHREALT
jgi:predicted alpha/beta hydrolase